MTLVGSKSVPRAGDAAVLVVLVLLAALMPTTLRAETVYVVERLQLGIHDDTGIDSTIIAIVPSGTELTVLERVDEFVKVTTPQGTTGWVDARYVVSEKPSVLLLEERETELGDTVRALGAARAELEVLRQELAELQRNMAGAASPDQQAAAPSPASNPGGEAEQLGNALAELQELAEENQRLKRQISQLQAARAAMVQEASAAPDSRDETDDPEDYRPVQEAPAGRPWSAWQWLLLGSLLLLAFGAGGYAVDWQFRRRHGGFRV